MSKSALKIYFSLVVFCLLSGCTTFNYGGERWPSPPKPQVKPVLILPIKDANIKDSGFYLSSECATNLVDNVDELKAYIEKLEIMIKEMKKYYRAK